MLSKENYGSRGNSSFFCFFLSRLGVYFQLSQCKIDISISSRMYLMSDEMDSVASIRSGVYLLLRFISFEWRVHHHFRLHVIFLFCANVHVRVCVSFSVFIDLLFKRKTDRFFSLSQVIYTHNIHFVSFSSDFINIESKFSTWIIHNHFD